MIVDGYLGVELDRIYIFWFVSVLRTNEQNKSLGGCRSLHTMLVHAMDKRGCEVDVKDTHDVGDMEQYAQDEQPCTCEFGWQESHGE